MVITEHRNADDSVSFQENHYLLKDQLGSVDLIVDKIITASARTGSQGMSFDPWGQRRSPTSLDNVYLSYSVIDLFAPGGLNEVTTRGFTGHEMLDGTGFIHMNGRVFDPYLARFVSADPLIQAPSNTQSYNRYSYTFNNPMKYTDPSGYSTWTDIRDFFTGRDFMQAIAKNPIMNSLVQAAGCFIATPAGCPAFLAAYSSIQTYHLTGDLGLAVKNGAISGLSAWASQGIGNSTTLGIEQKVLLSGLVGGLTSVAQGGDFGPGFMSAGVSTAFAPGIQSVTQSNLVGGMLVGALVGGTISEATGGKFANGAATGAFAQLLVGVEQSRAAAAQKDTGLGKWRRLTDGEKALAVDNGLDIKNVDRARVYRKGYMGLDKEIIAPNGNIYIGTENAVGLAWSEDYSLAGVSDQSVFLHEMVHVYQSRTMGCGRVCMGLNRMSNSNYDYQIDASSSFSSYGNEEQAAMVQDRFRLQNGLSHWRTNTSTISQLNGVIPF